MIEIILFETKDGKRFNTRMEAERHESLLRQCEIVDEHLKKRPHSFNKGYIRQTHYGVSKFKEALFELTRIHMKDDCFKKDNIDPRGSYAAMIIAHSESPITLLWNRFACIDDQNREWSCVPDVTNYDGRREEVEVA